MGVPLVQFKIFKIAFKILKKLKARIVFRKIPMQAKAISLGSATIKYAAWRWSFCITYLVQPGIIYFRAGMGVFGKHKKAFKYRFLFLKHNLINHQISCLEENVVSLCFSVFPLIISVKLSSAARSGRNCFTLFLSIPANNISQTIICGQIWMQLFYFVSQYSRQ